ncbi:Acyl-CoA dehydrogenase [Variovorax sp. SRS16]|uniref:acyl-CoA dehydrogenase family protein n=1 Tax=Variovorax sp. SRS16 TaxID=282217 RepID=UPI001319AC70|nr:acyl-CoA dehydrogenase family protein [Variovorax sp. SRS16]VTU21575.1 Acyl-CoA dehydrogenase [Variovorax sp. SRS16]
MSHSSSFADLEAFRAEVRAFLQQAVPDDIRAAVRAHTLVTREQASRWQRILHARGWAAPGWPVEHGGTGWSLTQQAVFREEIAACDAPRYENLGIDTIGPTIIRHGTPVQCARFLPRMLSFEDYWAQGYSEPDAGSDLASLRTVARRDGEHFVVSGTKIWQSYGHWADWALVLVRSDPSAARKQDGISVLLIDLKSPGVTIRPIRFMNGATFHVQMFFDEVRVPAENLVGARDGGWSVAKGLLVIERLFVARVAECKAELAHAAQLAAGRGAGGASLLDEDVHARRHAELDIRARALEAAWWPAIHAVQQGREPALEASLLKLQGNELLQDLHQLQLDLVGLDQLPFDPQAIAGIPADAPLSAGHVNNLPLHVWRYRGITLGGGTSEVQRGIVAKAVFGGQTELDAPLAAGLDEQQAMLDTTLRRLLADRYDFDTRRTIINDKLSFDDGFWRALAKLGLTGLLVSERDGGFGGTLADLMPAMEALGESLVVEPVLWNAVLPTQLLLDATGFAGRDRALQALMSEGARVAFVHGTGFSEGAVGAAGVTAHRDADGWRLEGQARLVMGGDSAGRLIVGARLGDGGMALFECASETAGIERHAYRLHDGRGAADLRFCSVRLSAEARLAGPERAGAIVEEALALATVALCAESVGAMRRALALTVEYMRTRKQFGRMLSDYQALQHRVVEHYRRWVNARALVREAAAGWLCASPVERSQRISAAKWLTGRAGRELALDALQLHGAVGLQDETAISHYAKRLAANDVLLGDTTHQLARFIAAGRQAS